MLETSPLHPDPRPPRRFPGITASDARRLQILGEKIAHELPQVVDEFYDRLLAAEPLGPFLEDPARLNHLREVLLTYLGEMLAGQYDAAYEETRRRVGERHLEVGLEMRWYMGSFSILMQLLLPRIVQAYPSDPQAFMETIVALSRVVALDQEIALDRYLELYTDKLDTANRMLREYAGDLQGMVERRTQELIRSGRFVLIGELASGLAHEIGTPLNIISGTSDWLRSELPEDSPHRAELATISQQTERITDLVWQLLRFARPEAAEMVATSLREVLDQVVAFLQHRLAKHHIDLTLEVPSDLPPLRAVPEQLQQVFLNLLVNAGHALEGYPTRKIRVVAERVDDYVDVQVLDTGPGIPERYLPRIFDPFFTTKPPGKGTGLGLSITQRILAEHNGSIRVSPASRGGTCFTVHIPTWREE